MSNISFAWTTPALLAGCKTVTRRQWTEGHAKRFHKGDLVTAYDKNPRFGGKPVATIRLTADPYQESTDLIPLDDWHSEGFEYLSEQNVLVNRKSPHELWKSWRVQPEVMWVIRFELVEVRQGNDQLSTKTLARRPT